MRSLFRSFNRFMLLLWGLGLGPMLNSWPAVGGRIMVITHTGRRSGKRRETPVNYAPDGAAVLCVAGFGRGCDWYQNLIADPRVEIRLPNGRWSGLAEDISHSAERASLVRRVLIASGFAAYLAGINPRRVADAELERRTEEYRLVRIRPDQQPKWRRPAQIDPEGLTPRTNTLQSTGLQDDGERRLLRTMPRTRPPAGFP